jgi:diguanylate cyclase (GGDEF)-like protein
MMFRSDETVETPATLADLGAALSRRALAISRDIVETWNQRSPESASAADLRVLEDIMRTTQAATASVTDYLERGALPSAKRSREIAASGKAPLRETISLADLTKLYLYWRDAMLRAVREESAALALPPGNVDNVEAIVRSGSDGSIVRMAKQFDVERERLQRELAHEQSRLAHLAFHDALSSLPNRRLFFDRLAHALDMTRRRSSTIAVLFVDIDDFKCVNDELGHLVGDELIVSVATRLVSAVRQVDTVARFGGDEFAILLEDLHDVASEAAQVMERVRVALAEPFELTGNVLRVSASVGLAYGKPGDDADALVGRADAAMYECKRARPR